MRKLLTIRQSFLVIFLITSLFFILVRCINNSDKNIQSKENNLTVTEKSTVNFQQFAGSKTCENCHKKIYDSHLQMGHTITSEPAAEQFIKGSFINGENNFPFNDHLIVKMEKRDSGLYQVAYSHGIEMVAKRFDIAVGSGAKGQTYLSWRNNELFQLPISYLTAAHEWANSPGYPNKVVFNRPITARCLECHSTYANVISPPGKEPEAFDRNEIIYGVTCEKCHGAAAKHVAYETENPQDKQGKYIIKLALLSRQQSLDLCGLCHGGRLQKIKPSFEFTAGDKLTDYFIKNTSGPITKEIDVHGNQLGLLNESKCFKNSATMTCVTCHDSHANERGKVELFSQRCMTCHNKEHGNFCTVDASKISSIKSNCIDCHMPKQPSMSIALLLPGNTIPTAALIHTHLIKVYPGETAKFISANKTK